MVSRFWALLCLLLEYSSVRRDARIRFLKAQLAIVRRKLGGNRVILSPEDRAELLRIGSELNHDVKGLLGIVTQQTYSRWVRHQAQGRPAHPVGRPRICSSLRQIIVRISRDNLGWGYRRILGELAKLHLRVGHSTIRRILIEEGLFPPPSRRVGLPFETPWRKFIRLHMNTLVACDFFVNQVITPLGIRLAYGLFFIHLGTRKVFLCPTTYHPDEQWIKQQARNVQMWMEDQGIQSRFLLHDHDAKFTAGFDELFRSVGTRVIKTPIQAPNANAYAEAWVGSLKRECLDYFVCFGLRHLDHIAGVYVDFYNAHRPHQGLGNRTLPSSAKGHAATGHESTTSADLGRIRCQRFLGGLLRHYYRVAA